MAVLALDLALHLGRGAAGRLMRHRGMQRVELVLEKDLPVRMLDHAEAGRHDLDLALGRAVAHVVERDARVAQEFVERRSIRGKAREDEAAVGIDPRGMLHVGVGIVRAEPRSLIALGQREAFERPIGVELPGVIGAGEGLVDMAVAIAADHRAAMRAAVIEHMDLAVAVAHHHHRLAADLDGVIVARLRHLRFMPAIDPDLVEDVVHLHREDGGVAVERMMDAVRLDKTRKVGGAIATHAEPPRMIAPTPRRQFIGCLRGFNRNAARRSMRAGPGSCLGLIALPMTSAGRLWPLGSFRHQ